ncbi:MAG: hypothetical protein P8J87_10030 [Verrucomicrobiales bacterium]|nr:hypothetical protein [Verrucomicrobiales bacterium]
MNTGPKSVPHIAPFTKTGPLLAVAIAASILPACNKNPASKTGEPTPPAPPKVVLQHDAIVRYPQTHWGELSRFEQRRDARLPPVSPPLTPLRDALSAEHALRTSPDITSLLNGLQLARSTRSISATEQSHDLFFRPTVVNWISHITPEHRDSVSGSISHFSQQLDSLGSHLIVVLLPNKLDSLAGTLVPGLGETSIAPEQTRLLLSLGENSVEFIDLRRQFRQAANAGKLPFHRYDHHWSQHGIEIAVNAVQQRLAHTPFATHAAKARSRTSVRTVTIPDLNSSLEFTDALPPDPRALVELRDYHFDGSPILSDPGSPVVVLGDSNVLHLSLARSPISGGFHAALSHGLGLPLTYQARTGTGLTVPAEFRAHFLDAPPPIVIMVVGALIVDPPTPWPLTPLTPSEDAEPLPGNGSVHVEITRASPVEDPRTSSYKEALVAYAATIDTGPGAPRHVRLVTWAIQGRKAIGITLDTGAHYSLTLRPFDLECATDPRLETIQLFDDSGLVLEPTYWFDPLTATITP